MSSLRIQGQWTTQTASSGDFLMGQSQCALQFRFRANAFVPSGTEILKTLGGNPLYITAIGTPTSPGLSLQLQGASGGLQRNVPYTVGTGCAFGISWDAAGSQIIWFQGTTWGGETGLGNTVAGSQPLVHGPSMSFGTTDFQVEDLTILHGAVWNSGDFADYASRAKDPSQLSTPATYWWTLGGTANATANPATDAGFLDQMGSGIRFGAASGSGSGVYSPDMLTTDNDGTVLDTYVTRSGRLLIPVVGAHHLGYEMVGNAGSHLYTISSVRRTADGSGYTTPTATLTGGSPSRSAVLTAEATPGGSVNVGVYDGGAGYRDTDSLSVVVSDPTGSGATFAIKLGGLPSPVTALSGTQPTVKKNGVAVALNPAASTNGAFWDDGVDKLDPWAAYQVAEADAFAPGDVVTWSALAGWASIATGALPAVAADTPASNYAGTLEPAFQVPKTGLSLATGVVLGGLPGYSLGAMALFANRRRVAANPGQGTGSRTYTLDDGLVSWSDGAAPVTAVANCNIPGNWLDDHGIPFLSGPTLVPSGGGSGAILVPVISDGVIRSIVVKDGGTGYPDSGTVAVLYGGGWGATATYTASGGAITGCTVTDGGGYSDGIWDLGYGDSAPGTPTVLTLTNGAANNNWISLEGLPSPLGDRWTSTGGGANITKAWYNYLDPNPSKWGPGVEMVYSGGALSGGTRTNGAVDIRVAPPNGTLAGAAGLAVGPTVVDWLTFGGGKYAGAVRFLGAQVSQAFTEVVDDSQVPKPGWWSYSNQLQYMIPAATPSDPGIYTGTVSSYALWDLSGAAEDIYIDSPWPGTVAAPGGSPAAYVWHPSDRHWADGGYAFKVTAPGHGIKTGNGVILGDLQTIAYVTDEDHFILPGSGASTIGGDTNTFTWTRPGEGYIPIEVCCKLVNELPGCAAWFCFTMAGSDEYVDAQCDEILRTLDAGHKCFIEIGNENSWNFGYNGTIFNLINGRFAGLDNVQCYVARAATMHARCLVKFTAAGRASDLVRVLGSFWVQPTTTGEIVAYANAHSIPFDVLAVAPYQGGEGDQGPLSSAASYQVAAASCAPSDPNSLQHGTAWPWTLAMYHDLWRHFLSYTSLNHGFADGHNDQLDAYTVGPRPQLVCYEGGIQGAMPTVGTGGGTTAPLQALVHDFFFHPGMKDLVSCYHLFLSKHGFTTSCYTALGSGPPPTWTNLWTLVTHSGQHPGAGDGSDGRVVNEFAVTNLDGSPGDGGAHLLQDVSTALEGLRQFGTLASPTPGALEFAVSSGFNVRAQATPHTDFNRIVSSGLSLAPAVVLAPTHNYVVATSFNLRPQVSTVPATYQYALSTGLDLHAQVTVSADRHYAVSATLGLHPEVSAESGTPVPLGRFRLGDVVPIPFTPTAPPDAPPEATISGPAAEQVRPMATWDGGQTFFCHERLTQPYDVGAHAVAVTSSAGRADYTFDVVEGGDRGSTVIALHHVSGPGGSQVLAQLASGQLVLGRNPHL
jgi:hypothetical protein